MTGTRKEALAPPGGLGPAGFETPTDSALMVAQSLWGIGNLSPLDNLFGSTALMKQLPAVEFAFIGVHLGRRLLRLAEETGVWIDTAEANPVLSKIHRKKNSTLRIAGWTDAPGILKKSRYSTLVVCQPCELTPDPGIVYRQAANALKPGGTLFAADLMAVSPGGHGAVSLRRLVDHVELLDASGFSVGETIDLSDGFMAAVRSGFFQSLGALKGLLGLAEPQRRQRCAAFCAELEKWQRLHALAGRQAVRAFGMVATRRG